MATLKDLASNLFNSGAQKVQSVANPILQSISQGANNFVTRDFNPQAKGTQSLQGLGSKIMGGMISPTNIGGSGVAGLQYLNKQYAGNNPIIDSISYGLRGATQLSPFQPVQNMPIIGKPLSKVPVLNGKDTLSLYKSTAPTNTRQEMSQSIGRNVYGSILTSPLLKGTGVLQKAGSALSNAGKASILGTAMSGAANLATGNPITKDSLAQGAVSGFENSWVLPVTGAALDGILSKGAKFVPALNKILRSNVSTPFKDGNIRQGIARTFTRALAEIVPENTAFTALQQLSKPEQESFMKAWMDNLPGAIAGNIISAGISSGTDIALNKQSREALKEAYRKATRPFSYMADSGSQRLPIWQYNFYKSVGIPLDKMERQRGSIDFNAKVGGTDPLTAGTTNPIDLRNQAKQYKQKGLLQLESNRASAEMAKAELSLYSPETIKDIGRLKRLAQTKDVLNGDIETLRAKDPVLADKVAMSVMEAHPEITTENSALFHAIDNIPKSREIRAQTPDELRIAKDLEKKARTAQKSETQSFKEWQQQVFSESNKGTRPEVQPSIEVPKTDLAFNPNQYVKEQAVKQNLSPEKVSLRVKADATLQAIKTKFEDFTTPIETALNRAEQKGKFKILPEQDLRYQIDKVLRADSLGTQFVKDNGLEGVIKNTDNLDNLNQYLIAKHATDVSGKGTTTGRDLTKDKQLVASLQAKYEPIAQQVYAYNASLRQYLVDSGLISPELSAQLGKESPNYVPLKRLFTETEQQALRTVGGKGGPASIGSQTVVQRLKGSEREILNPLESLLENTGLAFRQGERNKGARMLAGYIKNGIIPGTEVTGSVGGKHTVSFLDNGVKRTFEVSPDIASAAKNLNADQLSRALQIIAIPTRALQLGATGVNAPFVLGNLVKDQVTASVISQKPLSTTIINPVNFVKALFSAIKHDDQYDAWVRSGSSFTSYDMARGAAPLTIASIRSNKSAGSKVKYLATNPKALFRALEDIIGTTENLTRIQQYSGTKDALIKSGRTAVDADLLAGAASRTNTANFARKGEFGKVLNSVIPFFNAGIQGARSLRQSFAIDPKGTTLRFTAFVGVPITTATLWNLANYERKAAYEDIPDYEKEGNIIILPEKPVKDEKGNYNAIKIPITPGLANLAAIIRRQIEGVGVNPQEVGQILSDLSAAGTSFELPINADNARKLVSQFTPQGSKLALEPLLNKNLFTGQDIVPSYMTKLPANEQVKSDTSGTVRLIGKRLNVSPLKVENFMSSAFAGTGRQVLNTVDTVLASGGVIPKEQIGGRSIPEDVKRRFLVATGGKRVNELYKAGLTTKQIDKLLEEEKKTTAKFSDKRESSPEAPKTIMGKIELAAKATSKGDYKNVVKAIFTEEVMRKITNDALIFERKTDINPGSKDYSIDHTIPLSLGGDNSPENLVYYENTAKAKKDKLEAQLWRQLNAGEINKEEAQRQIKAFIAENGAGTPLVKSGKDYIKNIADAKAAKELSKTESPKAEKKTTIKIPKAKKVKISKPKKGKKPKLIKVKVPKFKKFKLAKIKLLKFKAPKKLKFKKKA